jgi:hypothetical protein
MKRTLITLFVAMIASMTAMAQVQEGDIQIIQQYFGLDKMALVKEYMKFTPKQDSAFWPIYNAYETERRAIGKERIKLVDEYMKAINNLNDASATSLVDRSNANEINFKKLQKKYFAQMSKAIGPVKAGQFYQFENYLNNIINLTIQENIPFVGELEQRHGTVGK